MEVRDQLCNPVSSPSPKNPPNRSSGGLHGWSGRCREEKTLLRLPRIEAGIRDFPDGNLVTILAELSQFHYNYLMVYQSGF